MSDAGGGNDQVVVKRRRRHRHRRNELIRRACAVALLAIFVASLSAVSLRYFSPSLFQYDGRAASAAIDELKLRRSSEEALEKAISEVRPSRPVYPYSIIAGGVEDAKELKWVAEHDPIVAAHYAGFDYNRARVVRLALARTVYLSYRIGNQVYWTRHRVSLRAGETLITDGRMTARSRCGNRVEETPQQAASPNEPPAEKFDEPLRTGEGTAVQSPPAPFNSALLNRPQVPGLEPAGPLSLYDPFVGGNFIPLSPPPIPVGLCAPTKKKGGTTTVETTGAGGKKKPGPCGTGGGGGVEVVPEPSTWILFASGLAAIFWHARRKFVQV